jgi:hypothetical protein
MFPPVSFQSKNSTVTQSKDIATPSDGAVPGTMSQNTAGMVTGSGRERSRVNANIEERGKHFFCARDNSIHPLGFSVLTHALSSLCLDHLLSTAILSTPKSPVFGNGSDSDQSLHHIHACIKSPTAFGSPTV